jgi:hypothetical protein
MLSIWGEERTVSVEVGSELFVLGSSYYDG